MSYRPDEHDPCGKCGAMLKACTCSPADGKAAATADEVAALDEYARGKHPASEVPMTAGEVVAVLDRLSAAESRITALVGALRESAIRWSDDEEAWICYVCDAEWRLAEKHAPGCLAALADEAERPQHLNPKP